MIANIIQKLLYSLKSVAGIRPYLLVALMPCGNDRLEDIERDLFEVWKIFANSRSCRAGICCNIRDGDRFDPPLNEERLCHLKYLFPLTSAMGNINSFALLSYGHGN